MMNFDINDLDTEALEARAYAEARLIYNKDSTRRGRELSEIMSTCKYGQAAEQFLIEKMGFDDDTRPYKDVIDPSGEPVEVKVTDGPYYIKYVLERANEAASQTWRKYPNLLYIFTCQKHTSLYKLHGIYKWDGTSFCLQSDKNDV